MAPDGAAAFGVKVDHGSLGTYAAKVDATREAVAKYFILLFSSKALNAKFDEVNRSD